VRPARIHATLENEVVDQLIVSDTQPFENRNPDVVFRVSYG